MKGYQRRAAGKPDYWKVAIWNQQLVCWQDQGRQHDDEGKAVASVVKPGRYRLSFVQDGKPRVDVREFVV